MLKHRLSVAEIDDQSAIELPDSGRFRMFRKKFLGVVCATAMVGGVAGVPAAGAADQTQRDGLIQVQVGDITITDAVDIGVAAQIAANICGVKVGPVAVLGAAVDRSGDSRTVCTTDQGDVVLTQN
ncbi:MAG: hypothetical protein H0U07_12290 [Actinobacteria bacterium]|nr:hypothetical protein [Actinomycetota bacterium]